MTTRFSYFSILALRPRPIAIAGAIVALALSGPALAHPPKAANEAAETAEHKSMDGMPGMKGMNGMHMKNMGGHAHGEEEFSFGHPSPDAKPDRVVRIEALDTMRFDPPMITVKPGNVIKFVVTNKGEIPHSWSIDTKAEQIEHEEGMEGMPMENMMGHMDGEPNGFVLKPGETKTLTWTFTKGGDIEYACHLPGHYGAGMHGQLKVQGVDDAKQASHENTATHGHDQSTAHEHEAH